jgi:hypothetical protein
MAGLINRLDDASYLLRATVYMTVGCWRVAEIDPCKHCCSSIHRMSCFDWEEHGKRSEIGMTSETPEVDAQNDPAGGVGARKNSTGWKADLTSLSRAAFGKSSLRLSDVVKQAGEIAVSAADKTLPLAPQIAEKLSAAETRLFNLHGELGEVALAAQLGDAEADAKLDVLSEKLRGATEAVAQLRAAHQRALEADAAAEAVALRERQAASLEALERHATARLEVMTRLANAIETAHHALNEFRDLSDKMVNAVPEGVSPPGLVFEPLSAIAAEMFRHAETGGHVLPGAIPPDFSRRDAPSTIEPITALVERNNHWLIGFLRDQLGSVEAA